MKRLVKRIIPTALRFPLRMVWLQIRGFMYGERFRYARPSAENIAQGRTYSKCIRIDQRINASKWAENKIHNLRLAISTFEDMPIHPGQWFSFWHYVKRPTKKAGYVVGINIIQNKLDFDVGGGLCQLSGLLYHLALTAGLDIIERHPHSVDLYTEETRYTPLGADATTAFGYKDLRLRNGLDTPVCFRFQLQQNQLTGFLCAARSLKEHELEFRNEVRGNTEFVETLRKNDRGVFETLCTQTYSIAEHGQIL